MGVVAAGSSNDETTSCWEGSVAPQRNLKISRKLIKSRTRTAARDLLVNFCCGGFVATASQPSANSYESALLAQEKRPVEAKSGRHPLRQRQRPGAPSGKIRKKYCVGVCEAQFEHTQGISSQGNARSSKRSSFGGKALETLSKRDVEAEPLILLDETSDHLVAAGVVNTFAAQTPVTEQEALSDHCLSSPHVELTQSSNSDVCVALIASGGKGDNRRTAPLPGETDLAERTDRVMGGDASAVVASPVAFYSPLADRSEELEIENLLPKADVRKMAIAHWNDLYASELKCRTLERDITRPATDPPPSAVPREHRHKIVRWMSEACNFSKWTRQTLFTAVHAWDSYMLLVPGVHDADLPPLAGACLYFAAQITESAADENVFTLQRFVELCPEAHSAKEVRSAQTRLIETLQGNSLARKTPLDFALLFAAEFDRLMSVEVKRNSSSPAARCYADLRARGLYSFYWSFAWNLSLGVYASGISLDGLTGSRWMGAAFLKVLRELGCTLMTTGDLAGQLSPFSEYVCIHAFHMDPRNLKFLGLEAVQNFMNLVLRTTTRAAIPKRTSDGSQRKEGSPQKPWEHRHPSDDELWEKVRPELPVVATCSLAIWRVVKSECESAASGRLTAAESQLVSENWRIGSLSGTAESQDGEGPPGIKSSVCMLAQQLSSNQRGGGKDSERRKTLSSTVSRQAGKNR